MKKILFYILYKKFEKKTLNKVFKNFFSDYTFAIFWTVLFILCVK